MCNAKSLYDPAGIFGGGGDQLHAKLGLGVKPETPAVVKIDPKAQAEQAANEAQATANATIAQQRKNRRASSLLATGAQGAGSTANVSSVLSYGKSTLGG